VSFVGIPGYTTPSKRRTILAGRGLPSRRPQPAPAGCSGSPRASPRRCPPAIIEPSIRDPAASRREPQGQSYPADGRPTNIFQNSCVRTLTTPRKSE
jgi:hypothetical protein